LDDAVTAKQRRIATLRFTLRQDVKRLGRAKTRLRALHYLHSLGLNPINKEYAEDYRAACRDVLGGEW